MKTLIRSIATAVVLTVSMPVLAAPDPVGPTPSHTDIFKVLHINTDDPVGVKAVVINGQSKPIHATYTFSRLQGNTWVAFKTGEVSLAARLPTTIRASIAKTKEPQKVKVEVRSTTPKASSGREMTLAAKKLYVLRYKTNGWVQVAYQFQKTTSQLTGQAVQKPAADCRALGFKTQIKQEHQTVLIGTDSYRTWAYARLDDYKEKTFQTDAERDKFERDLYKLVPSFTNDGTGLTTKKVER